MYLIIIGLLVLVLWLVVVLMQNDFNLPTRDVNDFKKILVVYPHPDDEVLTVGGLIKNLQTTKINTKIVVMTKGEAGESHVKNIQDLKIIRAQEMKHSASILGFNSLKLLDMGDGKLTNKKPETRRELERLVSKYKPELVITYDKSGLYGHPDHIVISEIITQLYKKYKFTLWYSVFPEKVMQLVRLPNHMANKAHFAKRRVLPTHKVYVGNGVISKIRAIYAHKTQYMSFRKPYPLKIIPVWFYISGALYEYFYEA